MGVIGIVSRAFSRKSSRLGLMTISSGRDCKATQAYNFAVFTPLPFALAEGIGGGGGGNKVLVLLWAVLGKGDVAVSFIPYSFDSFERVLGKDDPLEAFGDSVFRVFEL